MYNYKQLAQNQTLVQTYSKHVSLMNIIQYLIV